MVAIRYFLLLVFIAMVLTLMLISNTLIPNGTRIIILRPHLNLLVEAMWIRNKFLQIASCWLLLDIKIFWYGMKLIELKPPILESVTILLLNTNAMSLTVQFSLKLRQCCHSKNMTLSSYTCYSWNCSNCLISRGDENTNDSFSLRKRRPSWCHFTYLH